MVSVTPVVLRIFHEPITMAGANSVSTAAHTAAETASVRWLGQPVRLARVPAMIAVKIEKGTPASGTARIRLMEVYSSCVPQKKQHGVTVSVMFLQCRHARGAVRWRAE
jgi:hypothetical protein